MVHWHQVRSDQRGSVVGSRTRFLFLVSVNHTHLHILILVMLVSRKEAASVQKGHRVSYHTGMHNLNLIFNVGRKILWMCPELKFNITAAIKYNI